jgi:HlyD family secretion protein
MFGEIGTDFADPTQAAKVFCVTFYPTLRLGSGAPIAPVRDENRAWVAAFSPTLFSFLLSFFPMAKSKSSGGLIFLAIVVLGAAGGCWYYFYGRPEKQPEYSTVKVSRGNITQTISATGNLQTTSQVTISSQVSGNVIAINADFNDRVAKGQWILKIDPSTYQQKLRQAKSDLDSAKAIEVKTKGDTERSSDLFKKKLIAQSDLDTANSDLAQAEATLVSREAAYENAQTDLDRCIIYSPIEGVVLNRTIDVGATVNVNQSAVALYTIINDLTKLQISADVSEADIGNVQEKQLARFTVDAYLNRPFQGVVSQVRNFAKNTSGVVTFSVIVDVDNSNLLLKPGMTATANIIIAERPDVLLVANNALRVRIPPDLLAKASTTGSGKGPAMTDEERRTAMREIIANSGFQAGTPPSPEVIEKAKKLAADKGIDPDAIAQQLTRMANRGQGGGGGGGGGGGRSGGAGGNTSGAGMNVSNQPRTLYKLVTDATGKKIPEPITVHLGISDGTFTQIVDGANEGDTLVTYVTMPGAAPAITGPAPQSTNPFQQRPGGGGGGGGRGF